MNGMHVTLLGGITIVVIAYWLINNSKAAFKIGTGGAKAYGNVAKTFQGK